MCRSSTKSFGFLLLLWIGIFLPVTEYQVSHLASIGSLIDVASGDDEAAADELAQSGQCDRLSASCAADLSDFTLVGLLPSISLRCGPLDAQCISDGFTSRDLPPQERPPNSSAA